MATGVAFRLYAAGFPIIMTELEKPLLVRRTVCFGSAMFDETTTVEGITARCLPSTSALWLALRTEEIPLVADDGFAWQDFGTRVIIDARMAKRNIDTTIDDAELVIALGPGFVAGQDCHAVIETNRGHSLGRVIWQGPAIANTTMPGAVMGKTVTRVLRAPTDGFVEAHFAIGDAIQEGDTIATVADAPIVAEFDGRLRGIIHPSVPVTTDMKIGDLDPRGVYEHCFTISDKSLAVGGGVLAAILSAGILPLQVHLLPGRGIHAAG